MTEAEGTYAKLVEAVEDKTKQHILPPKRSSEAKNPASSEDLSTIPYISQNYRFTEDELKWLRRQAYSLTERQGTKVSQNAILRIALQSLRDACANNAKSNPLMEAVARLKK